MSMITQRLPLTLFAITFLIGLLSGCGCGVAKEAPKKQGLFVINVLDKALYDDCHIVGSVHVSLDDLNAFAQGLSKDAEIVAYCSNYLCTSSEFVARTLMAMGFKNLFVYEGGMAEWYQLGLPSEGPAQASYLTKKIEKPAEEEQRAIKIITAQELHQMMQQRSQAAA